MKKLKKLELKKVTLRNLDEPKLDAMAGGTGATCAATCGCTSILKTCGICASGRICP